MLFCRCCGNFFISKNKNNTLYCDRVFTTDGKTCKQAAPKLMAKYKRQNDEIFDEYERGFCKLDNEKTDKDLTRKQYNDWLERVNMALRQFKQEAISRDDFMVVIHETD